jgi:chromosome partitioning protein
MKVISIANQKGGVGKTMISVNLAFALKEAGKKVLFIDLDPQQNSTQTMHKAGCSVVENSSRLFEKGIDLTPIGDFDLIAADGAMADIERAENKVMSYFNENLRKLDGAYDFAVLDTPPTLGLRMTSALISSDFVISPVEMETYSIAGIQKMLQTIYGVKQRWNPGLEFIGMLPNRFNVRSISQKETLANLMEKYAHLLIPAHVGIRVSISDALTEGVPVWEVKKTSAKEAGKELKKAFSFIFKKIGVE